MPIALWCVLIAAFLPYLGTVTAKAGGRMPISANKSPRDWLDGLTGWPRRGEFYARNAFEAFPPFAAAVLIAMHLNAAQSRVDLLAMVFIGARIAHWAFYIANLSSLRSLAWFVGIYCVVALFLAGT